MTKCHLDYRMFEASVLVSIGRQIFERSIHVDTKTDMNNKLRRNTWFPGYFPDFSDQEFF